MNRNTISIGAVVALAVGFTGFNLWGYFTSQQKAREARAIAAEERRFEAQQAEEERKAEDRRAREAEELRLQAEREERIRQEKLAEERRAAEEARREAELVAERERREADEELRNIANARKIERVENFPSSLRTNLNGLSARYVRDEPQQFFEVLPTDLWSEGTARRLFREGTTTFMVYAALGEHEDVMKALIDIGNDVNHGNERGYSAVHWAAAYGNADILEVLLDHGGLINSRLEKFHDFTPLHIAAMFNPDPAVTKMLIRRGAEIDAKASDGITAPILLAAGMNQNLEILNLFIDEGADTDVYTEEGATLRMVVESRIARTNRARAYKKISNDFNIKLLAKL